MACCCPESIEYAQKAIQHKWSPYFIIIIELSPSPYCVLGNTSAGRLSPGDLKYLGKKRQKKIKAFFVIVRDRLTKDHG